MVVIPALDRHVPLGRDQLLPRISSRGRDATAWSWPHVRRWARTAIGCSNFCAASNAMPRGWKRSACCTWGCTRAKWQLRLTATIGRVEESEDSAEESSARGPWAPRMGSLLAVLWPLMSAQFETLNADSRNPGQKRRAGGRCAARGPLWRVPPDWSPRMSRGPEPAGTRLVGRCAKRLRSSTGPARLHGASALWSTPNFSPWIWRPATSAAYAAREPQFRRWLALHGVPDERLDDSAGRVIAALIAVQNDPRGRWILQQGREDVREHALSGRWQGEIAHVVFDRSFIDEEGVRWVIDYKTSQHLAAAWSSSSTARSYATGRSCSAMPRWRNASDPSPCGWGCIFRSCGMA